MAEPTEPTLFDLAAPTGGADISPCGTYRYRLWRTWAPELPTMVFVMLNPSKADALDDDPTITRCRGFARREGCGGIVVVNLFAYRATDPKRLRRCGGRLLAEGPQNESWIRSAALTPGARVVAAWGANGGLMGQDARVNSVLKSCGVAVECFGLTAGGHPFHPLMLRGDTPLIPYGGR